MPGLNRTGPLGQGARTGRGMGVCAPMNETGRETLYGVGRGGIPRGGGRGFGCGGRGGRGSRRSMWAPAPPAHMPAPPAHMTDAEESAALREQAAMLQAELNRITARLDELDAE